tara:strand:+ start:395 stop:574 length:180 start_codon:yes stop_codon:yes gene_type:complete
MIFGTPVALVLFFEIEKMLFGKSSNKSEGLLPWLKMGVYCILWWWFCMWFFVDFLGRSF